jgi:hypothetical protein
MLLVEDQLGRLGPYRPTANRTERFLLGPLDLGRVGAPAPLEVQMLPDRVVKQTHRRKAYSPLDTLAVANGARIVLFFPRRLAA